MKDTEKIWLGTLQRITHGFTPGDIKAGMTQIFINLFMPMTKQRNLPYNLMNSSEDNRSLHDPKQH